MTKKFYNSSGEQFELDRETKVLRLKSVNNTDYYKGKNHDEFRLLDNEGKEYVYNASLNSDMTEYDTKFGSELAFCENKHIKLSAYFVPQTKYKDEYYIYNPRILSIED